ncbi:MAG: MBL fold metallo-hydrolase [Promethearchaeota archaeon]
MERVNITFLGQSGFVLQKGSSSLIIDPSNKKAGERSGDVVFITHSHSDHTGGLETFLKHNPEATLVCNKQVIDRFRKWQDRVVLAIPGEEIEEKSWKLRFFSAQHGLFRGEQNTGVIVETSNLSFGHVGDAIEFQNFYEEKIDILAIPIVGMFAASPKKALKELQQFSQPVPVVIPMHWVWRSPQKFCRHFKTIFPNSQCVVPKIGELVEWLPPVD